MAPLRILCIHGYRQNGNSFREKTGALRKLLKKSVELIFMNAPHSVQQQANSVGKWTTHNAQLALAFNIHTTSPGCRLFNALTSGLTYSSALEMGQSPVKHRRTLLCSVYQYFLFNMVMNQLFNYISS